MDRMYASYTPTKYVNNYIKKVYNTLKTTSDCLLIGSSSTHTYIHTRVDVPYSYQQLYASGLVTHQCFIYTCMYVTLCVYVFGMSKENKILTPDHRLLNANSHLPTNTNRNEKENTHTNAHTKNERKKYFCISVRRNQFPHFYSINLICHQSQPYNTFWFGKWLRLH